MHSFSGEFLPSCLPGLFSLTTTSSLIADVLFLLAWRKSLRYHNLNPNYIHDRLKLLGQSFTLRVLLVQVDVVSRKFALALPAFRNAFNHLLSTGVFAVFRKSNHPRGNILLNRTVDYCLLNKAKRKCRAQYVAISD